MNYYKDNLEEYTDIKERYELMTERISMIPEEHAVPDVYQGYFSFVAHFIMLLDKVLKLTADGQIEKLSEEELEALNEELYVDITHENYVNSYCNPDYAVEKLAGENPSEQGIAQILSFLYYEIRGLIACAFEGRIVNITLFAELFMEIYSMFTFGVSEIELRNIIYSFEHDYAEYFMTCRIREQLDPVLSFATDIIMNSDLQDLSYLYRYGEYIGKNEKETAAFLNTMTEAEIENMASTYTEGFRLGFAAAGIDLSKKKTVNIRYVIGQERMVRAAIRQFQRMGLEPVCHRYAGNRINRRLMQKTGYQATALNQQMEYDHRMDEALFFDKKLMERKLEILEQAYKAYAYEASVYAGPACIEIFGEKPFDPVNKKYSPVLSKKQQELAVAYAAESAQIVNKYIRKDQYSFTIIAYPVPEIGENYQEIFREIVKINTLDNDLYRRIQQSLIDELDQAESIHVLGTGSNQTDILVNMHVLAHPEKETNFENCVADVNIPVGEVFTSPKLTGTEGILNVSEVYLHDLKYINLKLTFHDGMITDYSCDNFTEAEAGRNYIRENLLMGRETLPIGEFAIGTNTTAYVMANRYDIVYQLPILIVEKMGPHFAVGDTCYSWSEDTILHNPDGKEIVAKDNECSLLRDTDPSKAYFNCHTDITIPYDEIGGIYSVHPDGMRIPIIENGRFVLPGTEKLNEPFAES